MNSTFQPYREPLRATLTRTGTIAIVVGAVLAHWRDGWTRWPAATLLVLWPALGGHYVEIWFLNWLRPRLPIARPIQILARIAVWFIGGILLAIGMFLTWSILPGFRNTHPPSLWLAGPGFIVIELIAHLFLQLRGRPSFYNGRG